MIKTFLLLVLLVPLYTACSRPSHVMSSGVGATPAHRDDCEALIDRLMEVSKANYAVQTNVLNTPGNPVGQGEKGMLTLGADSPPQPDAYAELVARGCEAVPFLIKHLGDARATKFTPSTDA